MKTKLRLALLVVSLAAPGWGAQDNSGMISIETVSEQVSARPLSIDDGVLNYLDEEGQTNGVPLAQVRAVTVPGVDLTYYDFPEAFVFRKNVKPAGLRFVGISGGKLQYRLGDLHGDYKMLDVTMSMYFSDFEKVVFARPAAASTVTVDAPVYERIRAKAAADWPDNFAMQEWEIDRQLEAYRRLQSQ